MKTLNITFDNKEYNTLKKIKGDKTWHELIMTLTQQKQ